MKLKELNCFVGLSDICSHILMIYFCSDVKLRDDSVHAETGSRAKFFTLCENGASPEFFIAAKL